ncbi:quinon protein alcohol dehydrogenase-like superfamily [Dipodascopsis uninucleata]
MSLLWSRMDPENMVADTPEVGEVEKIEGNKNMKGEQLANGASTAAILPKFLTKHIPQRLYPESHKEPRSFCYRHHPDFKCKRQADESNMDVLQRGLENLPEQDQEAITHMWSLFSAAPAYERNLILQGILSQCCSPQLSYVSSMLRDLNRIDFVSALPSEISFKILCYLDASSLCKAAQVSHRWKMLADDDIVWHRMCEQHIDRKCTKCGWGLPLLEKRRLYESKKAIEERVQKLKESELEAEEDNKEDVAVLEVPSSTLKHKDSCLVTKGPEITSSTAVTDADEAAYERAAKRLKTNSESAEQIPVETSVPTRLTRPWKDVYSERLKVEQNWRRGRYQLKVLKGHTDGVMCLQFDHSVIITGSYDTTARVWDIETGNLLRVLSGHVRGVRALMFDDTKLITGSMDRTIRIWNYKTGECVSTLRGHTDGVVSLHFDSTLLASGSADSTIRVWNFKEKSFMTLRGHTDWVNSVFIHSETQTLFSASDDTTVRMWDLNTRECLRVFGGAQGINVSPNFQGHIGQVQVVIPVKIRSENEDDKDSDHSHDHGSSHGLISGVDSDHSSLPDDGDFKEKHDGSSDGSETSSSQVSRTLTRRQRRLPNILTASLDNTIKLWDSNTGECVKTLFGHVEGVWGLAADNFRIVSGAHDRLVKIWDRQSGRCLHTFSGHSAPVACVSLSDSRVASGSDDGEVRIYSFGVA